MEELKQSSRIVEDLREALALNGLQQKLAGSVSEQIQIICTIDYKHLVYLLNPVNGAHSLPVHGEGEG